MKEQQDVLYSIKELKELNTASYQKAITDLIRNAGGNEKAVERYAIQAGLLFDADGFERLSI